MSHLIQKALLTSLLKLAILSSVYAIDQVCYGHVGCFSNAPPFDHLLDLPVSPAALDVKFKLFTPFNRIRPVFLDFVDSKTLISSHFNSAFPVKIIIHGYLSRTHNNWVSELKDAILEKEKANIVVVDWARGASYMYKQCIANTRLVAAELKLMLNHMASLKGVSMSSVHIIGHSLGAHIAGFVGMEFNSTIGRITALDAADPSFNGRPINGRLDASDAIFVDAIHTDGGQFSLFQHRGFGLITPIGDVDFYVNGGKQQPGCESYLSRAYKIIGKRSFNMAVYFACNHYRSHELFIESVRSSCGFQSFPCRDYKMFEKGQCTSCGDTGCSKLGYYANNFPGRGSLYLKTMDKSPYCGDQYTVKAVFSDGIPQGTLYIHLIAEDYTTAKAKIDTFKSQVDDKTIQTVVVMKNHVSSNLVTVRIRIQHTFYHYYTDSPTAVMNHFEVIDMNNNLRFVSSSDKHTIRQSSYVSVAMDKTN